MYNLNFKNENLFKKIKEISVNGDNYKAGYKIGKITSNKINEIIEKDKFINQLPKTHTFNKNLLQFKTICKKFSKNYFEELEGLSEGANVDFDKLFILNVRELKFLYNEKNKLGGCTTCVVKNKNHFFVGHNEDGNINNDIYLLRSKIKNEPKLISVNYYGYLSGFSVSVNQYGLFCLSNYIESKTKIGVPFSFIARSNIVKQNIKEAIDNIKLLNKATGQNFMFFQNNKATNIETSNSDLILRNINQNYVHTNHYISKKLKKYQIKKINPSKTATIFRYKKSLKMLTENKNNTQSHIKKILKNHDNYPKSICQHGFNDFKTLGTILFNTRKKELKITYGNPCQNKFISYSL
jgi:isopenicillin-N N-acyltransferase like protein